MPKLILSFLTSPKTKGQTIYDLSQNTKYLETIISIVLIYTHTPISFYKIPIAINTLTSTIQNAPMAKVA